MGFHLARFNSTRLKGKPLMKIGEKTMIEHVYSRASEVLDNLVVATRQEGKTRVCFPI
ncbi:hypothetical protein N9K77_01135 [bacterium]|nr:hypothetical protein [bacterium]